MHKYQHVLKALIKVNPSNIWRLVTLRTSVANLDKHIGHQMAKWGPPTIHDDQANLLFKLLQDVTTKKNNCSTGARLPDFMKELVRCIRSDADRPRTEPSVKSEQLVAVSTKKAGADSLATRSPSSANRSAPRLRRYLIRVLTESNTEESLPATASYPEV